MHVSLLQLDHATSVVSSLLRFEFTADSVLSRHFSCHRKLGQIDRSVIADLCYAVLRHKRLLEARCSVEQAYIPQARKLVLAALTSEWGFPLRELESILSKEEKQWLPQMKAVNVADVSFAVRYSLPDWLYERFAAQYEAEELRALMQALNQAAPFDLRVNTHKNKRETVLTQLQNEGFVAANSRFSPFGLRLDQRKSLAKHPLFLDGSVEVQDEGSQLLGLLVEPKRGEMVADFCAGAGGKTLLLGALMRSTGRLYAFDISEKRLTRFKPRLKRSGLSNVHPMVIASENDIKIKRLAGKFDRVLVDAPCSGFGTLRRNPDLKWRQNEIGITELTQKQAAILLAASRLVKEGGRLVYATCSLLQEENEAIVHAFLANNAEFTIRPVHEILAAQSIALEGQNDFLKLFPHLHQTDGFFAAVLERKKIAKN